MGDVIWLVLVGLIIGKLIGVLIFGWFVVKLFGFGFFVGMCIIDLFVIGCVVVIGFIVVLFVVVVVFDVGLVQDVVKMGVLFSFGVVIFLIIVGKVIGVQK